MLPLLPLVLAIALTGAAIVCARCWRRVDRLLRDLVWDWRERALLRIRRDDWRFASFSAAVAAITFYALAALLWWRP